MPRPIVSKLSLLIIAYIPLLLVFHFNVAVKFPQFEQQGDSVKITDFAVYARIAKGFWLEDHPNVYEQETRNIILYNKPISGPKTEAGLHITPVGLLIFAPLAWISTYSLSFSYSVWVSLSLLLYVTAFSKMLVLNSSLSRQSRIVGGFAFLLTFCSSAMQNSLILGQTALFATALLAFALEMLKKEDRPDFRLGENCLVFLGFLSAIKPHYFGLMMGCMAIFGRWRTMSKVGVLVLVTCLLLSPRLGWDWPLLFLRGLLMHTGPSDPRLYQADFGTQLMNVFASAFSFSVGGWTSQKLSSMVMLLGCVVPTVLGASTSLRPTGIKNLRPSLCLALVASYMLFAPHVGSYEEVTLLLFYWGITTQSLSIPVGSSFLALTGLSANFFALKDALPRPLLWGLKCALLCGLTWLAREKSSPVARDA